MLWIDAIGLTLLVKAADNIVRVAAAKTVLGTKPKFLDPQMDFSN